MHPFINIFGLKIPSYGLMMAIAFIAAILIAYFRTKKAKLDPDKLMNVAIIAIVTGIAGSYLLYIFVTYSFKEIIASIANGSFSVFMSGGLVFYGGFILAALCCLLYMWKKKMNIPQYAAVIMPTIPLAHAIGRVGCFLAGCCYGKGCETPFEMFFAVTYKAGVPVSDVPTGVPVFPVQLFEAFLNIILFVILILYTRKRLKSFSVVFLYLFSYAIIRFTTELFRADEIRGIFLGFSTSQWISFGLFAIGIVGFILTRIKEKKLPPQDEDDMLDIPDEVIDVSASEGQSAVPAETEQAETVIEEAAEDRAEPVISENTDEPDKKAQTEEPTSEKE